MNSIIQATKVAIALSAAKDAVVTATRSNKERKNQEKCISEIEWSAAEKADLYRAHSSVDITAADFWNQVSTEITILF